MPLNPTDRFPPSNASHDTFRMFTLKVDQGRVRLVPSHDQSLHAEAFCSVPRPEEWLQSALALFATPMEFQSSTHFVGSIPLFELARELEELSTHEFELGEEGERLLRERMKGLGVGSDWSRLHLAWIDKELRDEIADFTRANFSLASVDELAAKITQFVARTIIRITQRLESRIGRPPAKKVLPGSASPLAEVLRNPPQKSSTVRSLPDVG